MAINSFGAVLIPKPANLSFSEAMNHCRRWLSANNIEPLLFRSANLPDGTMGFEIVFRRAAQNFSTVSSTQGFR